MKETKVPMETSIQVVGNDDLKKVVEKLSYRMKDCANQKTVEKVFAGIDKLDKRL